MYAHRLALLAMVGSACAQARAENPPKFDADTTLGAPVSYENLTVVPIVADKVPAKDEDYLVLDEGSDQGKIEIAEKEQASVNELSITNKSNRPLFLMSGEVIIGGKQDRIIGKDTILPPNQKVSVPVYCVEHGRWTDGETGTRFRSGKALAHTGLRAQAAQNDSQQKVWQEVASKNAQRKTESASGTYRVVATGGGGMADAVKPYEKTFGAGLGKGAQAERTVGMVVALNGKVIGIEKFQSPKLFAKMRDKLLRSYIVEAVDTPKTAGADKAPSADDIRGFASAQKDAAKEVILKAVDGKRTERTKAKGVVGTQVYDEANAPASGEPAKPVYENVQMAH